MATVFNYIEANQNLETWGTYGKTPTPIFEADRYFSYRPLWNGASNSCICGELELLFYGSCN